MQFFFTLVEVFLYSFVVYIFLNKGDKAIIYLPVLFFLDSIVGFPVVPAFIYYGVISLILLTLIFKNSDFFKHNLFSLCLIIFLIILLARSDSNAIERRDMFNVIWFLLCLPLITAIFTKYTREDIFKELSITSLIILSMFIINVVVSTIMKYDINAMYGFTGGILYGSLTATDFNILAIAIFILLVGLVKKTNPLQIIVTLVSLGLLILSMRRSVILVSLTGVLFVLYLVARQNIKGAVVLTTMVIIGGLIVGAKTDFVDSLSERYELRNLEERSLQEEKRFFEYELVYKDMFEKDRYSPWLGYGLFTSAGNYGDGEFYDRTLHGDFTNIVHSSGLIGISLYLLMIITTFFEISKLIKSRTDKLMLLFFIIAFVTYFLTGRYTQVGCMLLLFLGAGLPFARTSPVSINEKEFAQHRQLAYP